MTHSRPETAERIKQEKKATIASPLEYMPVFMTQHRVRVRSLPDGLLKQDHVTPSLTGDPFRHEPSDKPHLNFGVRKAMLDHATVKKSGKPSPYRASEIHGIGAFQRKRILLNIQLDS